MENEYKYYMQEYNGRENPPIQMLKKNMCYFCTIVTVHPSNIGE